jgi:hypothetical protein
MSRRAIIRVLAAAAILAGGLRTSSGFAECGCCGPSTLFEWCNNGGLKFNDSTDNDSPFDHPIQADRPGFGDCPTTVGCGAYQLELGYQYTFNRDSSGSQIDQQYPQALLRIGTCANWLELRVSWSMEQEKDDFSDVPIAVRAGRDGRLARAIPTFSQSSVGSDDMNVGFKAALTDQSDCLPQTAIVADMYLPTGSSAFTAGEVLPEIEFIYTWAFTKKLSTTGLTFLTDAVDGETSNTYLQISQGVETDYQINDCLGSYIEWDMSTPDGADTERTQQVFQGGFTLLLNNNVLADAEAGVGLNDATPDYFVGTGISMRM